jgi:hypothetical protein
VDGAFNVRVEVINEHKILVRVRERKKQRNKEGKREGKKEKETVVKDFVRKKLLKTAYRDTNK